MATPRVFVDGKAQRAYTVRFADREASKMRHLMAVSGLAATDILRLLVRQVEDIHVQFGPQGTAWTDYLGTKEDPA